MTCGIALSTSSFGELPCIDTPVYVSHVFIYVHPDRNRITIKVAIIFICTYLSGQKKWATPIVVPPIFRIELTRKS